MSRIRTIKPDFWEDEKIALLSPRARLLYIATWNFADDDGRLRWTPEYIKATVFMYDGLSTAAVRKLMDELEKLDLIRAYEGGITQQKLGVIPRFSSHQRINRPQVSRLPAPPESMNGSVNHSVNESPTTHEPLTTGMEGKGKERNSLRVASATRSKQNLSEEEPTVQAFVAQFVTECEGLGFKPLPEDKAVIGKRVKQLVAAGKSHRLIEVAIRTAAKENNPANLHRIATDIERDAAAQGVSA